MKAMNNNEKKNKGKELEYIKFVNIVPSITNQWYETVITSHGFMLFEW